MTQRDNKTLWELVGKITDWERCQKMSSKPFRPHFCDILLSRVAPQYYNDEELALIKSYFQEEEEEPQQHEELQQQQQHLQHGEASSSKTKPKPEKEKEKEKKRRREMHDDEEWRPIPSWVNKKSRTAKNASTPAPPAPSPPTASPPTQSPPSPPLPPSLPPQLSASSPPRSQPPPPAPVLPDEFKNRMRDLNGSDMQFVMRKNLSKTDLSANHNRLSMRMKEICCDFLTEAEKATLHERESAKGRLRGVEVKVLDPSLREYALILKRWEMKSTSIYCLLKDWKSVLSHNSLQEGDQLQIWSSRVDGKLFLLLNKLSTNLEHTVT